MLRIFCPTTRTSRPPRPSCGACVWAPILIQHIIILSFVFMGSVVDYRLGRSGFGIPLGAREYLSLFQKSMPDLGSTQPSIPRIHGFLYRVKLPGSEANHTPPFSAKSKMSGTVPLFRLYVYTAWKRKTLPFLWVWNLVSLMNGH